MRRFIVSGAKYKTIKKYCELMKSVGRSTKLAFLVTSGRVSRNEIKKIIVLKKIYGFELHLDCGTYTHNSTKDKKIKKKTNYGNYLRLLKEFYHEFDVVYSYDLFFEKNMYKKNYRIWKYLYDRGYKTIPVFHSYGNLVETRHFASKGIPEVALGKGSGKNEYINNIADYLQIFDVKVRLMGSGTFSNLRTYNVYSADSTIWASSGGRGEIIIQTVGIDGNLNYETWHVDDISNLEKNSEIREYLRKNCPYCVRALTKKSRAHEFRKIINLITTEHMADVLASNSRFVDAD